MYEQTDFEKGLIKFITEKLTAYFGLIDTLRNGGEEVDIDLQSSVHEFFRYLINSYMDQQNYILLPELYYCDKTGCYVDIVAVKPDKMEAYAFEVDININMKSARKLVEVGKVLRNRNLLKNIGKYRSYAILISRPSKLDNKISKLCKKNDSVIKFFNKNNIKFLYVSNIPFSTLVTPQLISFYTISK